MAKEIIAAFESGKPLKIHHMSWEEFIRLFDEIGMCKKNNG